MANIDNTIRVTKSIATNRGHDLSQFDRSVNPWSAFCKKCGCTVSVYRRVKHSKRNTIIGYSSWADGPYDQDCPKGGTMYRPFKTGKEV